MQRLRNHRWVGTLAAAAIVALVATASPTNIAKAADGPMPCSAFARSSFGSWRVTAPVMIDLGGRLYSPTVGTTFPAGATERGIEMSDVLDRQCGNQ